MLPRQLRRTLLSHPQPHPPLPPLRPSLRPHRPSSSQATKQAIGPFTAKAALMFAVTGTSLYLYFEHQKRLVAQHKADELATAKIGRPAIGGKFELVDTEGKRVDEGVLNGRWSLVYFGFTNCPDICPEELDKMSLVVSSIAKSHKVDIQPIFITCDPARDTVEAVRTYIKDFHPNMIGLTGTYEEIKKTCKAYRVYFSTPPNALPTDDYLVDHSIFFYLMDPAGKFVDAFGRSMGELEVGRKIAGYLEDWERGGGKGSWSE